MPYSKDHKHQSRRSILQAARDLFCLHGFNRVSINQIMRRAKMTHGAFYNHFKSKEELYSAAFVDSLKASRTARLVKGPLSIQNLVVLATSYWNLQETPSQELPGPETILFNEISSDNNQIQVLFSQAYSSLIRMLEIRIKALNKLQKQNYQIEPQQVANRARAVAVSLVGAVTISRAISDSDERCNLLQAAQEQILFLLGVNRNVLRNEDL
ncbi:TetR/AcrR family transcriptional regulator [Bowmanella pacifica]|uniref:HTH tetR-type domain-containing protein n=1 Tax=Bowmanella pacifica TaxID=502051 RepID=A0A918DI32_9ALTE|nr:TetR/AcrR family transcriptional regulator [Bowmanella pacifica]GGO66439.1 hypothetical protein GCM10010982_10630 [Bowmanella pacifica]